MMKDNYGLLSEEMQRYGCDNGKVVRVYPFADSLFRGNSDTDQLFLKKIHSTYTEQELSQLITFQQFQMKLRPFKNSTQFKNCLFWKIIYFISIFLCFLSLILASFNPLFGLLWLLVAYSLWLLSLLRFRCVRGKASQALVEYCSGINLQHLGLTISAVLKQKERNIFRWLRLNFKIPQRYNLCFSQISHFEIQSFTVMEDPNSVKLYIYNISTHSSPQKPIFESQQIDFDRQKLGKFISFEDVQYLLRPIKNTKNYRQLCFWRKVSFWLLMVLFVFWFLCLSPQNQNLYFLLLFADFILIIVVLVKTRRSVSRFIIDLSEHCNLVNEQQSKVQLKAQIIARSKDVNIFYIEVKNIALQSSINVQRE